MNNVHVLKCLNNVHKKQGISGMYLPVLSVCSLFVSFKPVAMFHDDVVSCPFFLHFPCLSFIG